MGQYKHKPKKHKKTTVSPTLAPSQWYSDRKTCWHLILDV